ncbi:integrase [Streptomonospora alba]|uniref:Integrase n=1 Tax=Streptomonospora alba TaxID=183763 RepID=A0A0C2JC72_9ACTN|nr:site-specific integrase [Streptomonospora alba]KIH99006.1 integrase [Streptomonospora alba]
MGYSRKRVGRNGKARYTAYYKDVKGRERSAGTFTTRKQADKAWQREETRLAEGRVGDPARGRMSFQRYVEETWLPNHQVEATTRQSYTYSLYKHIMPEFGPMRMVDILPEHVRAWVADLKDKGVSPVTIKYNKVLLSTIFTTALNDQVTYLHPCKGVKTPTVSAKPRTIITPEQFDTLYQELPDAETQVLVETAVESGLRWGELSELRGKDLDSRSRIVTVSRAVVQVNPKFHPEGKRFLVKEYPKDREYRRFKLSAQIMRKLQEHVAKRGLGSDDLLFEMQPDRLASPARRTEPDPESLGLTEPNDKGRQYRHGTLSGYSGGKCRCRHCKDAYAIYRAKRREQGSDNPRTPRTPDTDGHIPADWFRNQVWKPALKAADLGVRVRFHDLRHAHASWVLAGGADLEVVKERLGHSDIATTARYLHTLPDADGSALDAFDAVRNRSAK